jgi:predicted GH43/DUF377 family glycosyl hydrolase
MYYATINGKSYYSYSTHATQERAEVALEEYFSMDEVCEAEDPRIKKVDGRWCVLFPQG